jgi:integrating conjugative element protein (TIGR03749 family)
MKQSLRIILFLIATVSVSMESWAISADNAPRRVHWQNIPIPVVLTVGEERRVQFQAPVSVGVPASLQSRLRTQTVSGSVYLLAHAPFAKTRVLVRELEQGQTYLLDIRAGEEASSNEPIVVEVQTSAETTPASGGISTPGTHGYVSLTRFAAQQLFAPLRLLSPMTGVARVPVQQDSVFLLPNDAIEVIPLMAWRAGNLFLTAVRLRNRSADPQVLDPRQLRGNWLAATFQHARLLPAGHAADSTAVYLISAQPFAASL